MGIERHEQTIHQRGYTDANTHMKRCEISTTIRGMQMKASTYLSSWLKYNHPGITKGALGYESN